MKTSEQINEIGAALCRAQAAMKPARKDAVNPAFRSKYADLHAVWDAARVPLTANGLAIVQSVATLDGGIAVTTRLIHTSGQWIESEPLPVPVVKKDAHGYMGAVTYGKRGSLAALVCVVADEPDDDGNAAAGVNGNAEPEPKPRPRTNDGRPVLKEMAAKIAGDKAEQYLADILGCNVDALDPVKDRPKLMSAYTQMDAELKGRTS